MNRNHTAAIAIPGMQGLIVNEGLLSTEFSVRSHLSGEKALVLAVIAEAAADYLIYSRQSILFSDAEFYLFDSRDRSSPFAFLNACDVLGLDPNYWRSCFAQYRAKGKARYPRHKVIVAVRTAIEQQVVTKQ